ncbi:MAG: leucine--tRNA ligase, partial [Methanomicrobia archaeon]|nr:leucine--tRNA ligase [Methanomicrobia archaeon]
GVIDDIREIVKVAKLEGKNVYVYTAPEWSWEIAEIVKKKKNFNESIKDVMKDEKMRKKGKIVSKLINELIKNRIFSKRIDEADILKESREFIEKEVGMALKINNDYDPRNKKVFAIPTKPAIYIE